MRRDDPTATAVSDCSVMFEDRSPSASFIFFLLMITITGFAVCHIVRIRTSQEIKLNSRKHINLLQTIHQALKVYLLIWQLLM